MTKDCAASVNADKVHESFVVPLCAHRDWISLWFSPSTCSARSVESNIPGFAFHQHNNRLYPTNMVKIRKKNYTAVSEDKSLSGGPSRDSNRIEREMAASKAKASKGPKRKRAAESEAEDEESKQSNKRSRAHQRSCSIPGAETGNHPQSDEGPAPLRGHRRMRTYPSSAPGSITFERYPNRAAAPQPIQLPARVVAEADRIRLPGADDTDMLWDWDGREDPFGDFVTPPSSPGSDEVGLDEESDEDESGLEDHESQSEPSESESEESESEPEAAGEGRGEAEPGPEMPGNGPQIPGQAPFPINPHHFQQQQQQVPVANVLPNQPSPQVCHRCPHGKRIRSELEALISFISTTS